MRERTNLHACFLPENSNPTRIRPMNAPAHSRAYKKAKRQLARPFWKHYIPFHLVLSLFGFGIAFSPGSTWEAGFTVAGTMSLCNAYYYWLLKGYRQIIEEQAKLLGEA